MTAVRDGAFASRRAIAKSYNVANLADLSSAGMSRISPETEVSVNLRRISLDSALELMLRNPAIEGLTFIVVDEVLLITSQEEADNRIEVRVYRVDDLVRDPDSGEFDFDRLVDLIVTSVAHDTWQDNGNGEGGGGGGFF